MLINSIIPQESTIYNISCRIYFYHNCFSAHCHRHTTMLLAFVRYCMRQGKPPPVRGQKRSQKFIMARRGRKHSKTPRDGRWEGALYQGAQAGQSPPFGGYVVGEPIQPKRADSVGMPCKLTRCQQTCEFFGAFSKLGKLHFFTRGQSFHGSALSLYAGALHSACCWVKCACKH